MTQVNHTDHYLESPVETLQRHGRSFHWAGALLGGQQLNQAASLYSLCRAIDDLADNAVDPAQKAAARETLEELVNALQQNRPPAGNGRALFEQAHALFDNDATAISALVDMIHAIIGDLEPVAVQTHQDLRQYAYGVAGTVGVMMTCLFQVRHRAAALPHAIDLGIGMQLTNIARDVLEDAYLGRVYLPASGPAGPLTASDITSGEAIARRRAWDGIQELLMMAEAFYQNGMRGLGFLPLRARLSIAVAAGVYREIGVKILDRGESEYWRHRCVVGPWRKAAVSARALAGLVFHPEIRETVGDPSKLHRDLRISLDLPEQL